MTIDEAIAHEKELAKKSYLQGMLCHANPDDGKLDVYIESGKYHEQIAEWLEDYKQIKMLIPIEQALKAEYNKALDDIVTIIKERVGMDWEWDFCFIEEIAEQLKAGGMNEYNI